MQTQKITLSSEQKVSPEKQSNQPRGDHTKKEIEMQTQLDQNSTALAPMVRCAGEARRKPIGELLAEIRVTHPDWVARFEDAHLSVSASADLVEVLALAATAPGGPNGRLAGFVEGLYVNN